MTSDKPPKDTGHERRASDRQRVLKAGIIAFNQRHSTLPCMVRDVSETGARLTVSGTVSAPDTFELIIELDGIEASCEVVARKGSEIRVRFLALPRVVTPKRVQVISSQTSQRPVSLRRKPRDGEGY